MAKGNLFQGMGRGKVGDVVFSRLNGQQISRVRNRNPKNPKSAKQMYQRAIMATIMQAYSAGKEIFDHAFQGRAVGAENQRVFMSENAKLLRSQIVDALSAADITATTVRAVAPSAIAPVPNGYLISKGSYDQTFLTVNTDGTLVAAAKGTATSYAEYYAANGLRVGDIYTIVLFVAGNSLAYVTENAQGNTDILRSVKNTQFLYARLQVNEIPTTALGTEVVLSDIFSVTGGSLTIPATAIDTDTLDLADVIPASLGTVATSSFGVIRSRVDEDLRSTSYMVSPTVTDAYGLAANVINEIWRKGAQSLGDSDLILEGGDI